MSTIYNKTGYGYQDLTIVPETITDINSRSECDGFENNTLPIFTAPMSTIVNEKNIDIWKNNHITPIIPRNIARATREIMTYTADNWVAHSLNEFKDLFCQYNPNISQTNKTYKVCVDLANGHMKSLYEAINKAKELSREYRYELIVMTGNIANPETYKWICENAEVDYIRVSIGTGANCITSTQTSIHYPIATLIDACYKIKQDVQDVGMRNGKFIKKTVWESPFKEPVTEYYKSCPKIVADGGIRGYADVIKALGLGADYVMIGSLFTGLLESAAPLNIECYNSHYKYMFNSETGEIHDGIKWYGWNIWNHNYDDDRLTEIPWEHEKRNFIHDMKEITKESYGMSTKKAQKLIYPNAKTKTSEGCTKYIKVKETVHQWTDNMIAYLKSAMSYTNKRTINEFRGNVHFIVNSSCTVLSVNK